MKLFLVLGLLGCVLAACPDQDPALQEWNYGTNLNTLTLTNTKVKLRQDVTIQNLTIAADATLVFVDTAPGVKLRVANLVVHGQLWIGSPDCPYNNKAEIILTGNFTDAGQSTWGAKVLVALSGSRIEIHGKPYTPTWTSLVKTADEGATTIKLKDNVNWQVGQSIVIASSDYDEYQSEVVTITAVSGNTVSFTPALKFMHWGDSTPYVDESAEVGLLTRNVKISGEMDPRDPHPKGSGYGGHTMYRSGSSARLSYVEFTRVGQRGLLARYPVHYHVVESAPDAFVLGCSFHNTFQRCITIHWTNDLLLKDNVAYNSSGHCYFLEDGVEIGTRWEHNLGVITNAVTNPLFRIIPTDENQHAIFWITNPNNTFINNAAVGGRFGYWYALPLNPNGLAGEGGTFDGLIWPRYGVAKLFKGNIAHSNDFGLFIDQGPDATGLARESTSYRPRAATIDPAYKATGGIESQLQNAVAMDSVFENYTGHHCSDHGIWCRGSHMFFKNVILSNNRRGITCPGELNVMEDVIFVGDNANTGNPGSGDVFSKARMQGRSRFSPWDVTRSIAGWQNYDCCGPDMVFNALWFNYTDFKFLFTGEVRKASAIAWLNGNHPIPPRSRIRNARFELVEQRFFSSLQQSELVRPAYKSIVFVDGDGTLTGQCGAEVVSIDPFLLRPGCKFMAGWNLYLCPPGTVVHRFVQIKRYGNVYFNTQFGADLGNSANSTVYAPPSIPSEVGQIVLYRLDDGLQTTLQGMPEDATGNTVTWTQDYQLNLPANTEYFVVFSPDVGTPDKLQLGVYYSDPKEWYRFVFIYPVGTTFDPNRRISACDNIGNPWNCNLTAVNSKSELIANTYYWDANNGLLWIHVQAVTPNWEYLRGTAFYDHTSWIYVSAICPNNDCKVDPAVAQSKYDIIYASPVSYTAPTSTLCDKNGFNNVGKITYTPVAGGPVVSLFSDAFDNFGMDIPTWSVRSFSILTDSGAYAGNSYLGITAGAWGTPVFWKWNVNITLAALDASTDGEPAVQFAIKIRDILPLVINSTSQQLANEINLKAYVRESDRVTGAREWEAPVASPFTKDTAGWINSDQWYLITIPLSRFAPRLTNPSSAWTLNNRALDTQVSLSRFGISVQHGFPTTFYLDEVKFLRVSSASAPWPTPNYRNLPRTGAAILAADNLTPTFGAATTGGSGSGSGGSGTTGGGGGAPSTSSGGLQSKDIGLIVLGAALGIAIVAVLFLALRGKGRTSI